MIRFRIQILYLLSLIVLSAHAEIMSEQQISQVAKMYNNKSNGLYACKSEGRTIVFTFHTYPESDITKEQAINYFSNEQAATLSANAINVKYVFEVFGIVEKCININWYDFLNLSYKSRNIYNTINNKKSRGVNMQIAYPKGWEKFEGDGPHIVKKFGYKSDYFTILIQDLPTFFSKRESVDILNNGRTEFLDINQLQNGFNMKFSVIYKTYTANDEIGNYPAKKFYTDGIVSMKGYEARVVMVTWLILHEDKQITVGGMFFVNSEFELKVKETILNYIALTIRFPEQYTSNEYER